MQMDLSAAATQAGITKMREENSTYLTIPTACVFPDIISIPADPDVHIRVGSGARVTLLCSVEQKESVMHSLSLELGSDAYCTVVHVNSAGSDADVHIAQQSEGGEKAQIHWINVTLGGKTVTHTLKSRLTGADSTSSIDWISYAKAEEKYTFSARNIFDGMRGSGEITMRGVAEEKGHIKCNGMIEIGLKGGGTDTYLTQEVLMLDSSAKVDAIPGLEIKTNDVKASHSATVARVTPEDLFYFAARGIEEREARRMFVEGFLGEMLEQIEDTELSGKIGRMIQEKYGE
jgi:Fe-S cluster assembly scaffold protein SufB